VSEATDQFSYGEFGRRFFALAVTPERILAGVNTLAGQPIDVGPLGVGPGKIAKVTATGRIGSATARPIAGDAVSYRVLLPIELTFDVHLQVDRHRFHADLEVPLILTALAIEELKIFIDIASPLPNQVKVRLRAEGLRASLLNKVVGVDTELQRFVAKYVKREVTKPEIMAARTIDVLEAVEGAWRKVAPRPSNEQPSLIADLTDALEAEIEEHQDLISELTDPTIPPTDAPA
jgi:hypothetical protein